MSSEQNVTDVIIIGGGPAGLTAGIYSARSGLKTLLIEKLMPGGQVLLTDVVENFPGFPEPVSGFELMSRMREQAERFGLKIETAEAVKLDLFSNHKVISTDSGNFNGKAVILCMGASPKRLDISGEAELTGKGVSYCATCDGPFYKDQNVAVIGGGDSALEEALFLTKYVRSVHIIHRRDSFRAIKILQDRVISNKKITIHWDTVPVKLSGTGSLEGINIKNIKSGKESFLPTAGVFIFVGYKPNTDLCRGLLELDNAGFIKTNYDMSTSVPGVFAAGDNCSKLLRQISTAVGEGATAAFAAHKYLEES